MYRPVGIDPQTGHQIFKDCSGQYRELLHVCPSCGAENKMSGTVMLHGRRICEDCQKALRKYQSAKSRLNARSTYEAVAGQKKRLEHWLAIEEMGGLAPDGIHEEYKAVCRYLDYYDSLKPPEEEKHGISCPYCGKPAMAPKGATKSQQRCDECAKRYKRYRWLQQNIGALNYVQLVEFNNILDEYVVLMRKGWWAPNIPKYRAKIRKRLEVVEEC